MLEREPRTDGVEAGARTWVRGRRARTEARAMTRPIVAALATLLALQAGAAAGVARAEPGGPRVLYVTEARGYRHPVLPESEAILRRLAGEHGFELTVAHAAETAITPAALARLDVIVFYTTGELPLAEAQKSALLEFVRGGKGFVGLHSASDTFHRWPAYAELLGGRFRNHPWTQDDEVTVRVDDRTHPVTRHLPATLRLTEEIYQIAGFRPERSRVLVSLDTEATRMDKPGIVNEAFPLVWWHPYGAGRVFYSALGHRPEVWRSAWYQTMVARAIRWAAGELR
jgi:type 1 glutamine amidotransferase